jgi:hypothetical protein
MSISEPPEKRRPGRPRHESQSTEHITVTPELKASLDYFRGTLKKRSFNAVVQSMFNSYLFTLRSHMFLMKSIELIQKENETFQDAMNRMLKHLPAKIELEKEEHWVGDLSPKQINAFARDISS